MTEDIYIGVAHDMPNDVLLGGALITMVEPTPGFEATYNRWYEDDHFYSGATMGPWVFAARRFVATRALRAQRYPTGTTREGSYVSFYWHTAGHLADIERWAIEALQGELLPAGRGCPYRKHIYTAFHELSFAHIVDPEPMRSVHALDHPYSGVVVELLDAPAAAGRAELVDWLREEFVPTSARSVRSVGQCLAFTPLTFRADMAAEMGWNGQDPRCRVCLVWFLGEDPLDFWPAQFSEHESVLRSKGLAELRFASAFVPTIPGTERYVDELGESGTGAADRPDGRY